MRLKIICSKRLWGIGVTEQETQMSDGGGTIGQTSTTLNQYQFNRMRMRTVHCSMFKFCD